ncbi:MFS transporter [Streptomyces canus]|uniref:MFS transporter n=1 Tax=Streptomyces canus TaxID=58343 RepID=UPI0004915DAE
MLKNRPPRGEESAHTHGELTSSKTSSGFTLVAALFGFSLITLDTSVVNVALPFISSSLGGGVSGLQWVVDAYTLAFAALLLSSGALTDRVGASRAFAMGIVMFTISSVVCGLSPNLLALIVARTVQGSAAALVLPASLALVRQAYTDPVKRARAVTAWAAGGSVSMALGPIAGGALTTLWDWRAVFFINLPAGAVALLLLVRAPRSKRNPAPLDLPGQGLAIVALTSLAVAAIEEGKIRLIAIPIAMAAIAAFFLTEARQAHPIVPFDLFRNPAVRIAIAAGAACSVAFYGVVFLFSLSLAMHEDRSALDVGLVFLPMTGLIAVTNVLSGRLAERYGPWLPMAVGQSLAAIGALILLLVGAGTPAGLVSVLLVPMGLGCALALPPLTALMMDAVPAERAGLAAGVLNAARQMAGGLAIAGFGSLVAHDFAEGMRLSLMISAGLLGVTAVATSKLR